MSHGLERVESRRGLTVLHPRQWKLWSERRIVIAYVLTVDIVAVALAVAMIAVIPVNSGDLFRFGLLAAGAVIHQEAVRQIEVLRERASGNGLLPNLTSLWIFAAALSVPLPLAFALTMVVYLHAWYRGSSGRLYRKVFSGATMVLAPAAAVAVLQLVQPTEYPIIPHGPPGLAVLIGAGTAYWLVNYALVVGAVMMSDPLQSARQAMGNLSDQVVVAASLGLGVALAAMLAWEPWLIAVLMITVFALHRALLLPHFEQAARTDSKTGLLTAGFWREAAGRELARARRLAEPLGVLMLDLDHFKSFNDRMGHLVGDQLLRAVADELRSQTRPYDLVGRFGGEEFVILLPGVGAAQVEHIADRIRERISRLCVLVDGPHNRPMTVAGMSVSIGAAVRPDDGNEIEQLLLAADGALMAAKAAGRDRVHLATR
ncbi:MAG: GGDEF domain-containing protein [Actinomycetota bacterium]|nr:GGDEF domain-containing protein [Actinomycetota bacterium]